MSNETPPGAQPWDQLPGEPDLWFARFTAYRQLGPGRSLRAMAEAARLLRNAVAESAGRQPVSLRRPDGRRRDIPTCWRRAAQRWQWQARVHAWDDYLRRRRDALVEQRQQEAIDRAVVPIPRRPPASPGS